jgi:hypothetical protein
MVALSQQTTLQRPLAAETAAEQEGAYRLFWRLRVSGPWRREEFDSRDEAFDRFFYLVGKGLETRWRSV